MKYVLSKKCIVYLFLISFIQLKAQETVRFKEELFKQGMRKRLTAQKPPLKKPVFELQTIQEEPEPTLAYWALKNIQQKEKEDVYSGFFPSIMDEETLWSILFENIKKSRILVDLLADRLDRREELTEESIVLIETILKKIYPVLSPKQREKYSRTIYNIFNVYSDEKYDSLPRNVQLVFGVMLAYLHYKKSWRAELILSLLKQHEHRQRMKQLHNELREYIVSQPASDVVD